MYLNNYKHIINNILENYKENNSTFTHNKDTYFVDDLIKLSKKYDIKKYKVKDLIWIFKYNKPELNRPNKPDLKYPILITTYNDKLVVIDGLHRLELANNLNLEYINGIYIPEQEIKKLDTVGNRYSNGKFKIYHYFRDINTVNSILKHGLLSIDTMIKNKLMNVDHDEYNKYKNRYNIKDPNIYFKKIYDIYAKNLTKKEYTTYGIFFTTIDLFKFENKFIGRIELTLSDFIKDYDVIYTLKDNHFLVNKFSDIDIIIKLNKQFENKTKLKNLYFDKSKTYLFENLPQIVVWTNFIPITKNMIEIRR